MSASLSNRTPTANITGQSSLKCRSSRRSTRPTSMAPHGRCPHRRNAAPRAARPEQAPQHKSHSQAASAGSFNPALMRSRSAPHPTSVPRDLTEPSRFTNRRKSDSSCVLGGGQCAWRNPILWICGCGLLGRLRTAFGGMKQRHCFRSACQALSGGANLRTRRAARRPITVNLQNSRHKTSCADWHQLKSRFLADRVGVEISAKGQSFDQIPQLPCAWRGAQSVTALPCCSAWPSRSDRARRNIRSACPSCHSPT